MPFDHEKLDVYHAELEFIAWVTPLLSDVSRPHGRRVAEVCDQLDRASLSALLNTAEGNGKRQRPARAKFFDDARGSATECAACLDALVAKQACSRNRIQARGSGGLWAGRGDASNSGGCGLPWSRSMTAFAWEITVWSRSPMRR